MQTGVSVPFRGFRGLQEWLGYQGGARGAVVSVPFRGFRGLQDPNWGKPAMEAAREVSVPFRGFRGLQAAKARPDAPDFRRGFSPLPGF